MKKLTIGLATFLFISGCGNKIDNLNFKVASGAVLLLDASTINATGSSSGTCTTTNWVDSSGNGNSGTINCGSGGGFSGTGTTADPYRITFDGSNTYVSTSFKPQASTYASTTWLVWLKPSSTGFQHVLSTDNHGGAFGRSLVVDNSTHNWGAFYPSTTFASSSAVDTGSWQFVAVTFTPSNVYVYKNGRTDSLGSAPNYSATSNNFSIGRSGGGAFDYFSGAIAWVAVYPRSLTTTEIVETCQAIKSRFNSGSCN